jgi:hypothetical protein
VYFSDFAKVLIRQFPVVVAGAALTVGGGLLALSVVSTGYQATAQVLLLPPSDPIPEGEPVNPYLNLPGNLTLTASLIAAAVTTPDAQRESFADGFESMYATSVVPQTGPLIVLTVKDTDPLEALETRDDVLRQLDAELLRIQRVEEVPEEQLIRSRHFSVSSEAEALAGNRIRALGVTVAGGAIATMVIACAIDRWRSRRRGRAGSEPHAEPEWSVPEASERTGGSAVASRVDATGLDDLELWTGPPAEVQRVMVD